MSEPSLWPRFQEYLVRYDDIGFALDVSRMRFSSGFIQEMSSKIEGAFRAMRELEAGGIANPDEDRMVGHYWLRNSALAPNEDLRRDIEETKSRIKAFAGRLIKGEIRAANGEKFRHLLLIGIGGSALGPQFISDALARPEDPTQVSFLDNTDPDGFDRVFDQLGEELKRTLVIVVSKSGGTKETRNGMIETETRFQKLSIPFPAQAVAVTGTGSELDRYAEKGGWIDRFPMHDWVGGRTSIMSAVGLLPMALQGFDIEAFLAGAAAMDEKTRASEAKKNAAMMLALMWFYAGDGHGKKDMVVLPYKDRLALFSKYLQQLVMESLGKAKDLDGREVHQGIAVYGNKGSTDQHAYVQQLRDGVLNFFVTFIEVRKDRHEPPVQVEPGITSGDYLQGFLRGTRTALYESGRESITLTMPDVDAFSIGALIALYERAVGFYGSLVNINAYHQPGVEAGKKAATQVLQLQREVRSRLSAKPRTATDIAKDLGQDPEAVFHVLKHLAANDLSVRCEIGKTADEDRFSTASPG